MQQASMHRGAKGKNFQSQIVKGILITGLALLFLKIIASFFFFFLVVFAIICFFTNPSQDSFFIFLEKYKTDHNGTDEDVEAIEDGGSRSKKKKGWLSSIVSKVSHAASKRTWARTDFKLFSIVKSERSPEVFLGILNSWTPLSHSIALLEEYSYKLAPFLLSLHSSFSSLLASISSTPSSTPSSTSSSLLLSAGEGALLSPPSGPTDAHERGRQLWQQGSRLLQSGQVPAAQFSLAQAVTLLSSLLGQPHHIPPPLLSSSTPSSTPFYSTPLSPRSCKLVSTDLALCRQELARSLALAHPQAACLHLSLSISPLVDVGNFAAAAASQLEQAALELSLEQFKEAATGFKSAGDMFEMANLNRRACESWLQSAEVHVQIDQITEAIALLLQITQALPSQPASSDLLDSCRVKIVLSFLAMGESIRASDSLASFSSSPPRLSPLVIHFLQAAIKASEHQDVAGFDDAVFQFSLECPLDPFTHLLVSKARHALSKVDLT